MKKVYVKREVATQPNALSVGSAPADPLPAVIGALLPGTIVLCQQKYTIMQ